MYDLERVQSVQEIQTLLGVSRKCARRLRRAALSVAAADADRAVVTVTLGLPLFLGFASLEIPRTTADMLRLSRRLASSSASPELAKAVIRAAYQCAGDAPRAWRLQLSDGAVQASGTFDREAELLEAADVAEHVARTLTRLVRQIPAVWKASLLAAWASLAPELGATVERERLRVVSVRRGRRAVVDIAMVDEDVATRVRVTASAPREPIEADLTAITQLDATAELTPKGVTVVRPGLVADARTLSALLDAAFELAETLAPRSAYR